MNEIQKRDYQAPAACEDYNPYIAFGDSVTQSNIVGHLLRFTKFGDFVYSEDKKVLPHGTELIAHMGDVVLGWQRWQDNKPTDQIMMKVCEITDNHRPPSRSELGDLDTSKWQIDDSGKERDPWQQTTMMILKELDSDQIYTFSTSSKGGLQSVGRLAKEYGKQMRMRPDQYPVVRLAMGEYEHSKKEYGDIRYPIFEIVGWVVTAEIDDALRISRGEAEEKEEKEEKPVAPQSKARPISRHAPIKEQPRSKPRF